MIYDGVTTADESSVRKDDCPAGDGPESIENARGFEPAEETFMRKSNGFQGAWPGRRHVSVSQTRPVSGDVKKIQIFSSNPVFGVVVWFARAAKASVFELNSILITIVNTIVNDVRAIVSRIQKEYGQMLRTNNKILTLRFW